MSTTLAPFDHQVAVLAVSGMRQRAVAKQLNVHYNTVWRALHKPAVQQLVEELLARTEEESARLLAENLEKKRQEWLEARQQRRKRRSSMAALGQGQGMPLARESSYDPHWPIRQALARQSQAQAVPLEHGPDPVMADAQGREWQTRLEELKGMPW